MAKWLEEVAKLVQLRFNVLASILVLTVASLVVSDQWTHWIQSAIPIRNINQWAGDFGETAFTLGYVALLYYGVREAFVAVKKMQAPIPAWLDSLAKTAIPVLRLTHPLIGVLVFSVVLMHGYVMWQVLAAGNFSNPINTGLVAATILVAVALSGLYIRWMPKLIKFRHAHRIAGILFVLAFVVHKIVAD